MRQVQLLIVGDLDTGAIQVQGPIDDMRLVHWLLGEALRVCIHRADQRQAAGPSPIVLARGLPGNGGRG